MIVQAISQALHHHPCVIVPDFGGFVTLYRGAGFHSIKNTAVPPSKMLGFNPSLTWDDGLLKSLLCQSHTLEMAEAERVIKKFVSEQMEILRAQGSTSWDKIGVFRSNEEGNLVFEPFEKENYLDESFALPEIHFKPINQKIITMSTPQPQPQTTTSSPNQKKEVKSGGALKITLFVLIPLIVLGGAFGSLYFVKDGKYLAQMFPKLKLGKKAVEADSVATDSMATETASTESSSSDVDFSGGSSSSSSTSDDFSFDSPAPAATSHETATASTESHASHDTHSASSGGNTHIIGGVFSSRKNANKLVRKVKGAKVLEIGGMYKVSIASYASADEAKSHIESLRSQYGQELWVLENAH